MNILVITQMYSQPDDKGDNKPTKTVNYFVKEWTAMGHDVVVCHCSTKFPILYYYLPNILKKAIVEKTSCIIPPVESRKPLVRIEDNASIYRIPMKKFFPGQAYSERTIISVKELIIEILKKRSFTPNLVIGHFANPSCELVSKLSFFFNAMSSIVFHGDCTQKTVEKYRIKSSIQSIHAIGARSVCEARHIKSLLSLNYDPFICCSGVPNSVVKMAVRECTKQYCDNGISVLYVGSLIKRKHVDSVIEAFNYVFANNPKASLRIIGGGSEEEYLKKMVCGLEVENIVFLGRMTRESVFRYMKEANVFALISEEEVYGMVYIEAMLQGCLVIASKGGGFDGIIIDGFNGFLCNPGDEKMLAAIMQRIISLTPSERNTIGNNAIRTAEHYSEREVAEKYLHDILSFQGL